MGRRRKGRPVSGWLILDKPYELGSTAAVSKVRWLYNAQKAGHAGTLDPLATGMLPIALGEATKTVPYVVDGEKTYEFTVRWGQTTNTDDAEGEVTRSSKVRPNIEALQQILPHFTGPISQVPPAYSAIKIDGQRAYAKARAGEVFEMTARDVNIASLQLSEVLDKDRAKFVMVCSKGTYVRSLARDLASALGCDGHVCELRRTEVSPFTSKQMVTLDQLLECESDMLPLDDLLLSPLEAMSNLEQVALPNESVQRVLMGNSVLLRGNTIYVEDQDICAVNKGMLIAIGRYRQGLFHPKRVLNNNC